MASDGCSLVPLSMSLIVRDNDFIHPSKEQEDLALEKSRAYWLHIASLASAYLDRGFAPEFANPQRSLHKIPKFQGPLKSPFRCALGTSSVLALCSPASSTWKLVGDSDCEAVKKETRKSALVQIGTGSAITYSFTGNVFTRWTGTTAEKTAGPNYLGVLAIGWCYILSARLVEMQGGSAIMHYTSYYADCLGESLHNPPEESHIIDLGNGDIDAQTIRWWSAILAKPGGWQAIVVDGPDGTFVAPWSVSRSCGTHFIIKQRRISPPSVHQPLSSDDAFEALLKFARLHGLGSQFPIALTIAMSFPMYRYYGMDVKLPFPRGHGGQIPTATPDGTSSMRTNLKEDLPYYMTLSCSPEVLISTLCGMFWQKDIPCNMASQWLHPVLEEVLGDATNEKNHELLALIGAIRRPSVSALWIGAAVGGIGPRLLENLRAGIMVPLDSVAFPWTGAPQSFMDDAGSGPYTCEDPEYISRPDVWRLLHLPPTEPDCLWYRNRPQTPWEPCGRTLTTNCALRVTSHLKCPRHEYHYDHWNWELENGETVQDYGLLKEYPSLITEEISTTPDTKVMHLSKKKELDPDRWVSEEASIEIFRWFIFGGEGVPPEKIYHDELLSEMMWEQEQRDNDNEELIETDNRDPQGLVFKSKHLVEAWLNAID